MGNYKTLFGCLIFVVLWSSGWIGAKYGQEYAGTFTLLAYRYILVVAALLIFVTITRSWQAIPRNQLICHICVGILSHAIFLGTGNSALFLGVSAGLVAFVTALQPMITATLSSSIAGEQASFRQWSGLALGFTAVLLVLSDKIALGGSLFAYSLPFIAILALAVASLLDRRITLQNQSGGLKLPPLSLLSLIHCTSALCVMVPAAAVLEGFEANWGAELIFALLWLAIVVSLGAYGMMFYMLKKLSAVRVASLGYLSPPTTMVIAYFMFAERLSVVDLIGIALAGLAVWLVVSRQKLKILTPFNSNDTSVFSPRLVSPVQTLFNSTVSSTPNIIIPDIDLGENTAAIGIQSSLGTQQFIAQSVCTVQEFRALESRLNQQDEEIRHLKRVWGRLESCFSEIEMLKQALARVELERDDQRLYEMELRHVHDRLQM